ncbi:MAG: DUF748 domain-containing protein [Candidatus Omnitrophica bacterium]|nr:DUF748 domain-containing protein [Candidatus Omnitrophota bacterium]
MHPWRKRILFGIAAFLAFLLLVHLLVNVFGRAILTAKLQESFGKRVTIGRLSTYFPLGIVVRRLEIEDLCKIQEVAVSVGPFDLFRGKPSFSLLKLTRPQVTIRKSLPSPGQEILNVLNTPVQPAPTPAPQVASGIVLPRLFLGRLIISEGQFNFVDHEITKDGLEIKVEHLNVKVSNLNLGSWGQRTDFLLQGSIPWREGQERGSVELKGWIDGIKKSMEASLKIEKIDGIYLYPYYSAWVDLEKARIEKANLNFTSDIKGVDNNVTAICHLELTDIVRKPLPEGESEEKASKMTNAVLDIFKALDKGKVVLDFIIRTKMDRPEFGFGNIRMAFENKLSQVHSGSINPGDVLILPAKLLQGAGKGAVDMSKSVVDGVFAMGRELRKSVLDTLIKPPKVVVPEKK